MNKYSDLSRNVCIEEKSRLFKLLGIELYNTIRNKDYLSDVDKMSRFKSIVVRYSIEIDDLNDVINGVVQNG